MKKYSKFLFLLVLILVFGYPNGTGIYCSQKDATNGPFSISNDTGTLLVCSFNIQFLGSSKSRDNKALASVLKDYDIVVIQELVAPPYSGTFPDGKNYVPDAEAAAFFDQMKSLGFKYVLSEEDTGPGAKNHLNSPATEWWVSFYKPETVEAADDLPSGFLSKDRTNNDDYERVPHAFSFRTTDEKLDFVLISVHLKPDSSKASKERRKHELSSIASWIEDNNETEKDFIVLGDMNIENKAELSDAIPSGYLSLNDECVQTNTNVNGPKPYDHVMYNKAFTTEVDSEYDFKVIDLIKAMKPFWKKGTTEPYPGNPYNHNSFRKYYSDHHPVLFRLAIPEFDDD